jgi:hypothetical protein
MLYRIHHTGSEKSSINKYMCPLSTIVDRNHHLLHILCRSNRRVSANNKTERYDITAILEEISLFWSVTFYIKNKLLTSPAKCQMLLTRKLLNQWFLLAMLKSFKKIMKIKLGVNMNRTSSTISFRYSLIDSSLIWPSLWGCYPIVNHHLHRHHDKQ